MFYNYHIKWFSQAGHFLQREKPYGTRTLAPKYPRIEGLRYVLSNMAPLGGLVQPIDYLHYKCHALSDWSLEVLQLPLHHVTYEYY